MSACDHNWREHPCQHGRWKGTCLVCHELQQEKRAVDDCTQQIVDLKQENTRLRAQLEQARAEIERLKTINYRSPCVGGA